MAKKKHIPALTSLLVFFALPACFWRSDNTTIVAPTTVTTNSNAGGYHGAIAQALDPGACGKVRDVLRIDEEGKTVTRLGSSCSPKEATINFEDLDFVEQFPTVIGFENSVYSLYAAPIDPALPLTNYPEVLCHTADKQVSILIERQKEGEPELMSTLALGSEVGKPELTFAEVDAEIMTYVSNGSLVQLAIIVQNSQSTSPGWITYMDTMGKQRMDNVECRYMVGGHPPTRAGSVQASRSSPPTQVPIEVAFTWKDTSSIEERYRVQRSTDLNFARIDYEWLVPADSTAAQDSIQKAPAEIPDTYFYRVVAQNRWGESYSPPVRVDTLIRPVPVPPAPPIAPSNFRFEPGYLWRSVQLVWEDLNTHAWTGKIEVSTGEIGGPIAFSPLLQWVGFEPRQVWRDSKIVCNASFPESNSPSMYVFEDPSYRSFTFANLAEQTDYEFWITLTNTKGSIRVGPYSYRTGTASQPPVKPTYIRPLVRKDLVGLEWVGDSQNTNVYQVQIVDGSARFNADRILNGPRVSRGRTQFVKSTVNRYIDEYVVPGRVYYMRVRAINFAGKSEWSRAFVVRVPPED